MRFWINRRSSSNNLVVANTRNFLFGSVDKDSLDSVADQLNSSKKPKEVLGDSPVNVVPYTGIDTLQYANGSNSIEVKSSSRTKPVKHVLRFSDAAHAKDFFDFVGQSINASHSVDQNHSSMLQRSLPAVLALVTGLLGFILFFNVSRFVAFGAIMAAIGCAGYLLFRIKQNKDLKSVWLKNGSELPKNKQEFLAPAIAACAMLALGAGSFILPNQYGNDALYESFQHGSLQPADVSELIARGAKIEYRGKENKALLLMAIDAKQFAVASELVNAGADISNNVTGSGSVLEYALQAGADTQLKRALVKRGAVQFAAKTGFNASTYALDEEDDALVQLLDEYELLAEWY